MEEQPRSETGFNPIDWFAPVGFGLFAFIWLVSHWLSAATTHRLACVLGALDLLVFVAMVIVMDRRASKGDE